jgi:hypothetical protein
MTSIPTTPLPDVLDPIRDDLERANETLDRLEDELDPSSRAVLATDLIATASTISDTMERGVYGRLEPTTPDLARRARDESNRLRESMRAVDERTRNIEPEDVHRSDPDGFEHDLGELRRIFAEVMTWESNELYPRLTAFEGSDRAALKDHVANARKHASEHPISGGTLSRILHKVEAKMEHHPDVAHRT